MEKPQIMIDAYISTDQTDLSVTILTDVRTNKPNDAIALEVAHWMMQDQSMMDYKGINLYLKLYSETWLIKIRHGEIKGISKLDEDSPSLENIIFGGPIIEVMVAGEDFGVLSMTLAELDYIAVHKNGLVDSLPKDSLNQRRDMTGQCVQDWEFQWINTHNHVNSGDLILKPKTGRTKRLIVIGKAKYLIDEYGYDVDMAETTVRASYGLQNVLKPTILKTIPNLVKCLESFSFITEENKEDEATILGVKETYIEKYPDVTDSDLPTKSEWETLIAMISRWKALEEDKGIHPIFPRSMLNWFL